MITCYYCDKEGHIKRDCPRRKKDLAREESKLEQTSVAERPDEDPLGLLSVTNGMDVAIDSWIVVSCCDCHMSFRRDLFDTYIL